MIIGNILVNQSTKRKVIITGACGYIGSHISKALIHNGDYVIAIDLVCRGHTTKYFNKFVQADYDSDTVYNLLRQELPDVIIHCANYLSVGESVVNPAIYYDNNVAKTARLLNVVRELPKYPVVVFSSSASVYGSPHTIPINEESIKSPINPYGRTKLMIEQMLEDFDHAYGLRSASLRYFNACGADPYDSDLGQASGAGHIIARLLDCAINNTEFTLNGTDFNTNDRTCIRDYIHVWDIATAHLKVIDYLLKNNQSLRLNLGANLGYSNKDVIKTVKEIVGSIKINYGTRREGDPDCLIADSTKAHNLLDWIPQYSTMPVIVDTAWKWYQRRESI